MLHRLGGCFCLAFLGFSLAASGQETLAPIEPLQVEPIDQTPAKPPPTGAEETSEVPSDEATPPKVKPTVPSETPETGPATAADLIMQETTGDLPPDGVAPIPDEEASLEFDQIPFESEGPRGILEVGDSPYETTERFFETGSLIPVRPDGFDENLIPAVSSLSRGPKRRGFSLGGAISMAYDSNIHKSALVPIGQNEEDTIFGLAPSVGFASYGSEWKTQFDLQVSEQAYLENENYGGFGYEFKGLVGYEGAKMDLRFRAASSLERGGNRFSGAYQERFQHRLGVEVSYEISRKTRLDTELNLRLVDPIVGGSGETQSIAFLAAGLWKYSPLLEIGPGFRYRLDTGERNVDRSTYSPLIRSRYRLSTKVAMDGTLGGNFYDYAGGGTLDPALFASIGLHYKASRFWAANLSFLNDSVADESVAGAYRDTLGLRVGIDRKIYDAKLTLGLSYESITRTLPGGAAPPAGDTDSFSIDTRLSMPLWAEHGEAAIFARWRDQTGSTTQTWDAVQAGVSISYEY